MCKVYVDRRWEEISGIGTFSKNINERNSYCTIDFSGDPISPLDCINTSLLLRKQKEGIVFFPGYIPPLFSKVKYVFTIHDLNHLDRKENSSFFKKLFYNLIIKRGCKKANYIFTVSEFSKRRIVEWSGVLPDKVINVGNGVSDAFSPEGEPYNFDFPYILCVSNRKGHKNELGTIESFSKAKIDTSVKLVFTGNPNDIILNEISKAGVSDRVVFTGRVAENDLPKLYRSAKALIFVSFYEGFGLPVIEAQASGIPVITSNSTSLKEIAGDSAILVDPYDIKEISRAIEILMENNDDLINGLVKKGLLNSKKYSWKKTSELVNYYLNK